MELEARMFKAYAKGDEKIQLKIIPGHFVTSQSHISHYLDMTTMKTRCAEASRIARLLSSRYETSTPVDSIICMDGLEVIGAFLAEEPVFRRSTRKFPSFLFSYFAHLFLRTSIFPIFTGIFQCPF